MIVLMVKYTLQGDDETIKRIREQKDVKKYLLGLIRGNNPVRAHVSGLAQDLIVRFEQDVPMSERRKK